eukprot:scpid93087/ scgid13970/ 
MKRRWEPDTSPDLGTSKAKGLKRLCTCKSSPRPTQDGRNNCKHLPNISPWTESVIRDDELKGIPLSSLCKKRKHYVADDDDGVASSKREKAAERECAGNENVRPVRSNKATPSLVPSSSAAPAQDKSAGTTDVSTSMSSSSPSPPPAFNAFNFWRTALPVVPAACEVSNTSMDQS